MVVLDRCPEGVGFLKNLVGLLDSWPDKAPKNEDDLLTCLGCNTQMLSVKISFLLIMRTISIHINVGRNKHKL